MQNDAKNFTEENAPEAPNTGPRESHDASGLLQFLWKRVDVKKATEEELEWLTFVHEGAELMAFNLSKTLSGVAALVAWETDNKGMGSDAFQHSDMPELLWAAADTLATIEQMISIGSEASFDLKQRYRKRAEALAEAQEVSDRAIVAQAAATRTQVLHDIRKGQQETEAGVKEICHG